MLWAFVWCSYIFDEFITENLPFKPNIVYVFKDKLFIYAMNPGVKISDAFHLIKIQAFRLNYFFNSSKMQYASRPAIIFFCFINDINEITLQRDIHCGERHTFVRL